ncbi:hypothetical protein FRC01_002560 [Tulasnella sp. 417]|nr:hypothetical protein FRC01_002560 [Tulasnella sp. 417]
MKVLEMEIVGDPLSVNNFFYAAATRSPKLESLTLKTDIKAMDVENSLRAAISNWTALQSLTVPRYYLRPSVLEAAASLPNLLSLQVNYLNKPQYDQAALLQDLPSNGFSKLETFGFNSMLPTALVMQTFRRSFTTLETVVPTSYRSAWIVV